MLKSQNHSKQFVIPIAILLWVVLMVHPAWAEKDCLSISHKPVKLEAGLSKRYEKDLKNIRKEFGEMGNTVVGLFVYPAENPSREIK